MGKDATGTDYTTPLHWQRLLESIPASYTVWYNSSDNKYYAECNKKGGTDYGPLTDAGAVINSAINALSSSGGVVFLRQGTYSCTTRPDLSDKPVYLYGEGMRNTIISKAGDVLKMVNSDTSMANKQGILNLTLDGVDSSGMGLNFSKVYDCVFQNIFVTNIDTGIDVYDSWCNDFITMDVVTANTGIKLQYLNDAVNACNFIGGRLTSITGDAVYVYGQCINNHFYGMTLQTVNNGVHLKSKYSGGSTYVPLGNTFSDLYFETVTTSHFLLDKDASATQGPSGSVISKPCLNYNASKTVIDIKHGIANIFENLIFADAGSNTATISCDANSQLNRFKTFSYIWNVPTITFSNSGTNNKIDNDSAVYRTVNTGYSTGTGAQQTIAHGLASTPDRIWFSNVEDGANPYISATSNATNIYVTAVSGKDYIWKAEIV